LQTPIQSPPCSEGSRHDYTYIQLAKEGSPLRGVCHQSPTQ